MVITSDSQFHVLRHFQRPTNDFDAGQFVFYNESGLLPSGQSRRRHSQIAVHPSDRTSDHSGVNARDKKVPRFVRAANENSKCLVRTRQLPHFSYAAIPPRKESARRFDNLFNVWIVCVHVTLCQPAPNARLARWQPRPTGGCGSAKLHSTTTENLTRRSTDHSRDSYRSLL